MVIILELTLAKGILAGTPVYVNAAHIVSFHPVEAGSELVLSGNQEAGYYVKETPAQILAQIPAHV